MKNKSFQNNNRLFYNRLKIDCFCSIMSEDSKVKLLIKAANQKYEDFPVECELNWTVKRLKAHLHQFYPTKPVQLLNKV